MPIKRALGKKPFENIVGKRENIENQHCLPCPQRVLRRIAAFEPHRISRLQILSVWTRLKLCCFVLIPAYLKRIMQISCTRRLVTDWGLLRAVTRCQFGIKTKGLTLLKCELRLLYDDIIVPT